MSKYVIYARKSTESDDRQVQSIDSQIQELRLVARRQGIVVAEVLQEAHSAKAPGRPVFNQLMRRALNGDVTGVLCWKLDRLARNHLDHGAVLQALHDGKLEAIITPERTYTGTGNDRFIGNFEFGIATKFLDDLRANIKRGIRARFERGQPNYAPPIGYLPSPNHQGVIKDPERFDLVRRIWDLFLTGSLRPRQIARLAAKDWGLRTRRTAHQGGNLITPESIYGILKNRFYTGIMRPRGGETYRGNFPPMVTPEEFERAQTMIHHRSRPRPSQHEFAYAGMFHCEQCQRVMTGEKHPRPVNTYVYYRCRRCRADGQAIKSIREGDFDRDILRHLERLAIVKEAGVWLIENLRKTMEADVTQLRSARESLCRAFEGTEGEWQQLLTLKLRSQVDEESFERRRLELMDRKATLKLKLDEPASTTEQLVDRAEEILNFAVTAPRAFLAAKDDPIGRRAIVQAVTANWKVEYGKCLYLAKEPFSFLVRDGTSEGWYTVLQNLRTFLLATRDFRLPDLHNGEHATVRPNRERLP